MRLTVNGAAVFAATGGQDFDPGRSVLLFVHGAGCDHTIWQQQTRYFAHHGHAVLAPDLPAHGSSEGPPLATVPALVKNWVCRFAISRSVATGSLSVSTPRVAGRLTNRMERRWACQS